MTNDRECFMPLTAAVRHFMRQGEQSVDRFNGRQATMYLGLQFEELAEKVAALMGGALTISDRERYRPLHDMLVKFANEFKAGLHEGDLLRCDHNELLDADFDLAWVSIAALYSESIAAQHAIAHGAFTNLDKFRNGVVKDANGKIQKPADWRKPDFEPYTDKSIRA